MIRIIDNYISVLSLYTLCGHTGHFSNAVAGIFLHVSKISSDRWSDIFGDDVQFLFIEIILSLLVVIITYIQENAS